MCRPRVLLFCLLVATMNASAQDSAPPLRAPSAKEKEQALAALAAARSALFPLGRNAEARQLLARIAPLLAAAWDTAGAQEVLILLPANDRDAIQPQIVAAQVRSGEVAAALQPTLTREQAQAALDSLRRVRPLYLRARAAMRTSQLLAAGGKTGEAKEAIHVGLEVADTLQDDNLRGMLLAAKARALAAAKDWEGARAAVDEIADGPERSSALVDIAFSAADDRHAQLALSWATAEASPLSEASVLVSVAEALLHQRQQTLFIR